MSKHKYTRGNITLLLLVMLIVFVIIASSSLTLISQQAHQTVNQNHTLVALDVADAGIQYASWLLSPTGGNQTPDTLMSDPPDSASDHPVTNASGATLGTFTLSFPSYCSPKLQVRSIGKDTNLPDLCQVVEATLQKDPVSSEYKVARWDQLPGYPCAEPPVSSPLVCSPTATPTFSPLP